MMMLMVIVMVMVMVCSAENRAFFACSLFAKPGWYSFGRYAGEFSLGPGATNEQSRFNIAPALPTALVVARNIQVEFHGEKGSLSQLKQLGPFTSLTPSLSSTSQKSSMTEVISTKGPQVIGMLTTVLPFSPPQSDPNVVPREMPSLHRTSSSSQQ